MTTPEHPGKKQRHYKRRGHGEGSVFERKGIRVGKKNWVAQIQLENGKKKQFYFETEKEAQRGLRQALHDLEQGKLITERDQTMKQFLEYWLEVHRNLCASTPIGFTGRTLIGTFYRSWDMFDCKICRLGILKNCMRET